MNDEPVHGEQVAKLVAGDEVQILHSNNDARFSTRLDRFIAMTTVAGVLLAGVLGYNAIRVQQAVEQVRSTANIAKELSDRLTANQITARDTMLKRCVQDRDTTASFAKLNRFKARNDRALANDLAGVVIERKVAEAIRIDLYNRSTGEDNEAAILEQSLPQACQYPFLPLKPK